MSLSCMNPIMKIRDQSQNWEKQKGCLRSNEIQFLVILWFFFWNIETALGECPVFAGICDLSFYVTHLNLSIRKYQNMYLYLGGGGVDFGINSNPQVNWNGKKYLGIRRDIPANTKYLANIYTASVQRLRCWTNIVYMLCKCFVFAGWYLVIMVIITHHACAVPATGCVWCCDSCDRVTVK